MRIEWLGPCSQEARSLKEALDQFKEGKKYSHSSPVLTSLHMIVSENIHLMDGYFQSSIHQFQILVTSKVEFQNSVSGGLRPSHRYFHLYDEQPLEHFIDLLHLGLKYSTSPSPSKAPKSTTLGMQNSLEVLRQLATEQVRTLEDFLKNDEQRRFHLHGLVRLVRSLTMSHDIEEVISSFWRDLKKISNLLNLSVVIGSETEPEITILQKSGKFHFQHLNKSINNNQSLFNSLWNNLIEKSQLATFNHFGDFLSKLTGPEFQTSWFYDLPSTHSQFRIFIILAAPSDWNPSPQTRESLFERFHFLHLSLEKELLDHNLKKKTRLWEKTFDSFTDPLAIINNEHSVIRSNRAFKDIEQKRLEPNGFEELKSLTTWVQELITTSRQSTTPVPMFDLFFEIRSFKIPFMEYHQTGNLILHLCDVTKSRNLYSQLIQSEKMQAVEKLAGDLNQTLTEPLNSIRRKIKSLVVLPTQTSQLEKDATEILKATQRSLQIIADFKAFSEGRVEKSVFPVEKIIERTIPLVKALLHGIRFQIQLSDKTHSVFGSQSLLQQVLYNLLRNAYQAMDGKGEMLVRTSSSQMNDKLGVLIEVLDSGPGIPDSIKRALFISLQTTKAPNEGSGLGLHIVRKIVMEHNGDVGFSNRPTGGAQFWFWLPLTERTQDS